MPKKRINLYVDGDLAERSKAALNAIGSSLSEFFEDYLSANIAMLEMAAESQDPNKVIKEFHGNLPSQLAKQFDQLSQFMRTVQEEVDRQAIESE